MKIIVYVVGILAVLGACLVGGYGFGHHVEHQARLAEVADIKRQHADELATAQKGRADAEQHARDVEQKAATDMAALDAQHTKEMTDAKAEADRTIADLRNGTLRLRSRFTCPAAGSTDTAGVVPQASGSASVGAAGQTHGLQSEDVEFLVREAQRADEVTVQLRACQAIVRGDRDGR